MLLRDGMLLRPKVLAEWDGQALALTAIGAPMAVVNADGLVVGATAQAQVLLKRFGIARREPPFRLAESLWGALCAAPMGEAIEWQPQGGEPGVSLGCTRYSFGDERVLVLMSEVSAKRADLYKLVHRQGRQSTGRLVAAIAHDVRTAVASLVYNAAWMEVSAAKITPSELEEAAVEIHSVGRRLQVTVNRLLDFAKLGPAFSDELSLQDILRGVVSLVRPLYREGGHSLHTLVHGGGHALRANALIVEQILVNLLLNAVEAATVPVTVSITTEEAGEEPLRRVRIVVQDDGPGIPESVKARLFQPFFTTRADGVGLGLVTAREAARDLGGDLVLEPCSAGARFVVTLPSGSSILDGGA